MTPPVTIAICTNGRVSSLRETLQSIIGLLYDTFEVCVVYGPALDGTAEMLRAWADKIKVVACPEANLSMARNIAIEHAHSEIVAFLDDDAIPEPTWLNELVAAYEEDVVGAAGGFVYDHTGTAFQHRFATCDRLGRADQTWSRATPELNFPFTTDFPHLLGTNCSFRRRALLAVGGFDEEYDYMLDETDLQLRLIDAGWHIRQLTGACVHHKSLSSSIRTEQRILKSWYSLFKNRIYYGLINRGDDHGLTEVIDEAHRLIHLYAGWLPEGVAKGLLSPSDRERFHVEVERAWEEGLRRGLSGMRRLMSAERRGRSPQPFKAFRSNPF